MKQKKIFVFLRILKNSTSRIFREYLKDIYYEAIKQKINYYDLLKRQRYKKKKFELFEHFEMLEQEILIKKNNDVPYFILFFSYCKQTQSVVHETMKNYQV